MSSSVLLADVGNSRVKLASLDLSLIQGFEWRLKEGREQLSLAILQAQPSRIFVASTSVQADEILAAEIWRGHDLCCLRGADLPIEVVSSGTGIDRLLSTWLAWSECQSAVIVADCGTAFTVDYMAADGRFLGGAIGPGLEAQRRALAAACPHLEGPRNPGLGIPQDTAGAVYAGTSLALAHAINGLADRFDEQQAGPAIRYLSGGDGLHLHPYLKHWQLRADMVLEALALYAKQHACDD